MKTIFNANTLLSILFIQIWTFGIQCTDSNTPCQFIVTESIPEGVVFDEGPVTNSTFDSLLDLINSSERSLDVASFYWTLKGRDVMPNPDASSSEGEAVLESLVSAAKRGVKVRIAYDSGRLSSKADLHQLREAGVVMRPVNFTRLIGAGVLHTKFLISDNTSFYVGSANMDWRSFTQVKEMGVTVYNCQVLSQDLFKVLEVYWILGREGDSLIPTEWPNYLDTTINKDHPLEMKLGNSMSRIFISSSPAPFNPRGRTDDIDAVLSVINSAKKFIYVAVMDYFPTYLYKKPTEYWPLIDDALRKAAIERNVDVRVMASRWKSTRSMMLKFLKSLDALESYSSRGGGIRAKLFYVPSDERQQKIPFARVNHNKYMVTDETAYIGTSNWSADYFTKTGGVGFVVREANVSCYQDLSLRESLVRVFERDWNSNYTRFVSDIKYLTNFDKRKP